MRKILMNPWTIAVGSGLLLYLIPKGIDLLWNVGAWPIVWSVISYPIHIIWLALTWTFTINIFFTILLFCAGGVTMLILFRWANTPMEEPFQQDNHPSFLSYTRDTFHDEVYQWGWQNGIGSWEVINLAQLCPKCDCPLVNDSCPECGYRVSHVMGLPSKHSAREIVTMIEHRIKKRGY